LTRAVPTDGICCNRPAGTRLKRMALCLFLPALLSCAAYRQLSIESSVPASVIEWGGNVVCAETPCVMRVSRETCGPYDSSKGHIILTARSRIGLSMVSMAIPTCDVTDGMRLRYEFPSAGNASNCGVVLYDADRERFRLSCRDALDKKGN
jgi:hypothetical protein